MEYRQFGKTDMIINRVGFGGIPLQRLNLFTAIDVVRTALKKGVNFFDTARGYTTSEEFLGYALTGVNRNDYYLATKSMARTYQGMKSDIELSLKNLKTDYIDLYQIHNVSSDSDLQAALDGAYKALREAKAEGKIRYIGITSHNYDLLNSVIDLDLFDSMQFPYNIVEDKSSKLFKKAYNLKMGTICMKPLAGGAIDNGAIAVKYLLNDEAVDIIIPGMADEKEVNENLSVIKGEYTEEELAYIENIKKTLDNEFCRRCGYCMPCPAGVNIPSAFLFSGYYTRYNLTAWAVQRYEELDGKASKCVGCGECIIKCPYKLDIPRKLKEVKEIFGK